jgi:poly(3-hydroxybutyrate) depolymerase
MGEDAIVVYPKSFTLGWEQPEIRDKNAQFFEALLNQIESDACVDERRVFVMGTSSGASFSNLLACRFGDRIRAAGPVAGSLPEESCKGTPAMVLVHGIDDPHVPFAAGEKARDFFLKRNGCSSATRPLLADAHAKIRKARDANQTDQACVDYVDCSAASPVRWCEHSEGGYDGSTHGWPMAGGQLLWDFMKAL